MDYRKYYSTIFEEWLTGDYEDVWDIHSKNNHPNSQTRRKIPNPKVMAIKVVDYFVNRKENELPITYLGMILQCGLHSRSAFDRYMKYSPDFKSLIKTIKIVIEENIVEDLYGDNFKASQFLLKNVYSGIYSETVHQVVENKDFTIDVKNPNKQN